jgi:hypothetical protein
VAHVLADRDGCTAELCAAFGLLRDKSQVSENIREHKYESYVLHHALEWPQSSLSPVAAAVPTPSALPAASPTAPPGAASPAPAKPNGLFFPSSSSIPAVSIMSAEPSAPPSAGADAPKPPAGTDKPAATAARKPTPPPPRRPANPTNPTNLVPPARAAGTSEPPGDQ